MSLSAKSVTVEFGGILALDDVEVEVEPGQIVGLVGPNGAGKTTLFNSITGLVKPTSAIVDLDGQSLDDLPPNKRAKHRLARTFQTPRVTPHESVLDAVRMGAYPRLSQSLFAAVFSPPATRRQEAEIRDEAVELIDRLQVSPDPGMRVSQLSLGRLRLLEVARALMARPRYVLLDEPAAGIDSSEREVLAAAIRSAAETGIGVLIVEHNVPFVAGLADEISVLVNGRVLTHGTPADVTSDPRVIDVYLQRSST